MRTIQRDIVGPFIFSADNKLLVGRSRKGGVYPGTLIVPGGGVEHGETLLQALHRETIEETGIDLTNEIVEEIPGTFTGESETHLRDTGEHVLAKMTFHNFKVNLKENAGDVSLKTEDDFIEPIWIHLDDLKSHPLSPPTIVTLKKLKLL